MSDVDVDLIKKLKAVLPMLSSRNDISIARSLLVWFKKSYHLSDSQRSIAQTILASAGMEREKYS